MAKRKKSKGISTLSLILVLVMIVGAALAFTGLFLDWTTSTTNVIVGSVENNSTLQDWADRHELAPEFGGEIKYFVMTNLFAWISAAAVAAAAVLFILKLVIRLKLLGIIGGVAGIIGLVCGILAIVFTVLMGNEYSAGNETLGNAVAPAIGCYLLMAGGILGGGAAIGAAVKS